MTVLEDFERAMTRRNLAPGTIKARRYELGRWMEQAGDWRTATADELEQYLDSRSLGPRARYSALSHVHRFYQWALRRELVQRDPTLQIDRPRLPRRLPRPARLGDVQVAIMGAPEHVGTAMLLMVDAGLRCCEVARLEWDDVDLNRGTVMVRGKGDRDRMVGLTAVLAARLARSNATEGPVLGRYVTPCRVSQIVNAALRRAGVRATAHQLRHTFATRAQEHCSLLELATLLGHASVTNTQIYAAIDARAAVEKVRRLDAA